MECIEKYIEKNYSDERKAHTYAVYDIAKKLSRRYGADEEKAGIAALFHDMFRDIGHDALDRYIERFDLDDLYRNNANLAHGKIAAAVMKSDYGIGDTDILNAVDFHTTGRVGMSMLEKVIFLADAIEPGRCYPGVSEIRELAYEDLDGACIRVMDSTIEYVRDHGLFLDEHTGDAREYLKKEKNMNNREIADFAAKILDKKKAVDIAIIDIGNKSSFADYFLLASGNSERQIGSLRDEVADQLSKQNVTVKNIEGKPASGWILMDYGDVIINILTAEMRLRYNIEKVWGDCEMIDVGVQNAY